MHTAGFFSLHVPYSAALFFFLIKTYNFKQFAQKFWPLYFALNYKQMILM